MANPAPKTRNWRALENAHKPKGLHVLVFGEVEVSATNKDPVLTEAPERNPKNLGLHLTMNTASGEGADVMVWKLARFHKEVKADEFDHVVVRWDVEQIANFPVHNDREHAAHAAAAMKKLNAQHPSEGKAKPAAKKPAAKKAAKKSVKKSAKKSAEKSGLKKLVSKLVKKLTPAKKKKRR